MAKSFRLKTTSFWLLIAMLVTPMAHSDDIHTATKLMQNGKFLEASEIAADVGGSEGFTLAARALAIHGYEIANDSEKQNHFKRAIAYAEKAVELDPNSSAASLEVSHTLGRYAQTIGVAEALTGGFAEKTKTAMDRAVQLDPENFKAHLSIGSWNAEIVAAAGFMAKMLYGATEENALAAYQRALELQPSSGLAHFEYAMGLLRLSDDNISLASNHLEKALSRLGTEDAYAQIIRQKALRALSELQKK